MIRDVYIYDSFKIERRCQKRAPGKTSVIKYELKIIDGLVGTIKNSSFFCQCKNLLKVNKYMPLRDEHQWSVLCSSADFIGIWNCVS